MKQRLSRWIVDAPMPHWSTSPIPQEASSHHGRGLAVCLLQRSVRRPAVCICVIVNVGVWQEWQEDSTL